METVLDKYAAWWTTCYRSNRNAEMALAILLERKYGRIYASSSKELYQIHGGEGPDSTQSLHPNGRKRRLLPPQSVYYPSGSRRLFLAGCLNGSLRL